MNAPYRQPILTDQLGTVLIGVGPADHQGLAVRGGQGRTSRDLTAPILRLWSLISKAWRWLVEPIK